MVSLKCQQCGAALHWDGQGYVVRCIYCGAEYLMHPRSEGFQQRRSDPYQGTGAVQGIPIVPGNDCSGMCPVESYAPKGWKVSAAQASPDYYGDHMNNPFVAEARYEAPDGSALVLYRGTNLYTDRKLSRVPLLQGIDVLGSYLRVSTPFQAEQYCDYLLRRDLQLLNAQRLQVEQADAAERQRQQNIRQQLESQGMQQITSDWKRITYAVVDQNRRELLVSVETRINDAHKLGMQPMQMGGFFGQFMGQMFQNDEHYWETHYEMLVITDRAHFESASNQARHILETLQPTKDLERIRHSLAQYLQNLRNQAAINMHQQEMASWERRSKILQDTHNYTTNVMREMNANTAATNERVANLRSEAIRGVNTYYTANPGSGDPKVVEASINWDHVYQSTRNSDLFAASENYWLEPGVDFEELKRTNGGYYY